MNYLEIESVVGREILDSRGNPTVEAEKMLVDRNLTSLRELCNFFVMGEARGKAKGRLEGKREERLDAIQNMMDLGLTKEQILRKYSLEEYEAALRSMPAKV